MNATIKAVTGAAGLSLTWAAGWAAAGLLTGAASLVTPFLPWDAFFRVFDAPLPALGMPGAIAGAIFSALIRIGENRCSFEVLSLGRFGAWGAAAGLLLCLVPAAMASVGLATLNPPGGLLRLTALISVPLISLGAVSGAASLLLARLARPWRTLLTRLLNGDRPVNGR